MDGGYRSPRASDGRTASRPAASRAEAQPASEEPKTAQHATAAHHAPKKKKSKKFLKPLIIGLIVVAVLVGGWFAWNKLQTSSLAIDSSKYQAVFFSNGQVYFGKLQAMNGDYLKLTDVFYLQAKAAENTDEGDSENPQETSGSGNSNVELIKLGQEIHGPEDQMVISKEQVLFYENLKSDGKVAESIDAYNKSK